MSVKKSRPANLSRNRNKCQEIIGQINSLTSLIRSGNASDLDITVCKTLTNKLNRFISRVKDIDEFYIWLASETIDMANYSCTRYDRSNIDDKI